MGVGTSFHLVEEKTGAQPPFKGSSQNGLELKQHKSAPSEDQTYTSPSVFLLFRLATLTSTIYMNCQVISYALIRHLSQNTPK
mgnify:CR=1 FL=1